MKRKNILFGVAFMAIAAVATLNLNLSSQKANLSELELANVEALSQSEASGQGTLYGSKYPIGYDSNGNPIYGFCCCPGTNSCGAATCSNCG